MASIKNGEVTSTYQTKKNICYRVSDSAKYNSNRIKSPPLTFND